jgi:hypothetical protein
MLQDFHFKIVHWLGSKHFNFYALNRNLMFVFKDNEDFQVGIPNQMMSFSNSAMEKEVRFVTKNTDFPEIPNFLPYQRHVTGNNKKNRSDNSKPKTSFWNSEF